MKIGFFGCSFTEGGGFNSPIYVDYAIKNNIIDISELDNKVKIWGNTEREAYETYGKDYNGPFNSISKKLPCKYSPLSPNLFFASCKKILSLLIERTFDNHSPVLPSKILIVSLI